MFGWVVRHRNPTTALVAVCAAALLLTACGSGTDPATSVGSDGEPVSGGVARVIQVREPLSLDPAILANNWVGQGLLGNALYGTLMIDDPHTLELEYRMAEDFATSDGGATFLLTLRPDLMFTDGTPLDAEAVKANWDRILDPSLGSGSLTLASQIASTEVVDDATLKVILVAPNPKFGNSITSSALNWIASPTALNKGTDAFNADPVGAGPFTLTEWTRQDRMKLERNPDYWDAPRPYLDSLELRAVSDANQRVNMMVSGGADLASESSWAALAKADQAGLVTDAVPVGGGQYLVMNTRRAPFDDPRAREAVSAAVNLDDINTAVFEGHGEVPDTLFPESSPFHADIPLRQNDPERAQQLFDELAAEGKPVEFTFTATSLVEIKSVAESLQAQLAAYDNVDVQVEVLDIAGYMPRTAARDFDMIIWAADSPEPDTTLWNAFHSTSSGNHTGISDPELDAALDAGRTGTSGEDRVAAYRTVQERLAELEPGIWYIRSAPSVISGQNLHGVQMYALGSALPEGMWLTP